MAPKTKTLSDAELDDLDEQIDGEVDDDFGEGLEDESTPTAEVDEDPEVEDPELESDEEIEAVSVRELAKAAGFELDDGDDDAASLETFFGQAAQLRDFARQAAQERQRLQQQLAYFQNQQYQQPQQQQQPKATEAEKKELTGLLKHWQNVPEFHSDWLSYVEVDENNNLVAKPGADPTLPQKIEAYRRWENQAQKAMLSNPQQFAFEALQANPSFQDYLSQQIHQAVNTLQDQIQADQVAQKRAQFIYADDQNGEKQLTPAGQAYFNAIRIAESKGITDTSSLDEIGWNSALPHVQAMLAQHQAAQQQQQEETPREAKKRRQLQLAKKGATKKTNRGQPKSKRKIRNQDDFVEVALARMQESGIDPHERIPS